MMGTDGRGPGRGRRRAAVLVLCGLLGAGAGAAPAAGKVFHARDEALELAFPDADSVTPRQFFLTAGERRRIEELGRAPLESDLVTIYEGRRNGAVVGYAVFDTHLVRTLPETFLVVLSPEGVVTGTHLLAFHEPLEYMPGDRWLAQFPGRGREAELVVGRDVAGITGSTLTARAVAAGVRRVLALYAVLVAGDR